MLRLDGPHSLVLQERQHDTELLVRGSPAVSCQVDHEPG
jgi:hypothetical protein